MSMQLTTKTINVKRAYQSTRPHLEALSHSTQSVVFWENDLPRKNVTGKLLRFRSIMPGKGNKRTLEGCFSSLNEKMNREDVMSSGVAFFANATDMKWFAWVFCGAWHDFMLECVHDWLPNSRKVTNSGCSSPKKATASIWRRSTQTWSTRTRHCLRWGWSIMTLGIKEQWEPASSRYFPLGSNLYTPYNNDSFTSWRGA